MPRSVRGKRGARLRGGFPGVRPERCSSTGVGPCATGSARRAMRLDAADAFGQRWSRRTRSVGSPGVTRMPPFDIVFVDPPKPPGGASRGRGRSRGARLAGPGRPGLVRNRPPLRASRAPGPDGPSSSPGGPERCGIISPPANRQTLRRTRTFQHHGKGGGIPRHVRPHPQRPHRPNPAGVPPLRPGHRRGRGERRQEPVLLADRAGRARLRRAEEVRQRGRRVLRRAPCALRARAERPTSWYAGSVPSPTSSTSCSSPT